jgi:RHS repeat-associated protein
MKIATNHVTGPSYDANGNQIPVLGKTSYDVASRMEVGDGTEHYGYAADNLRVWKWKVRSTEEVTFWGPSGRMANYTVGVVGSTLVFTEVTRNVWFGGKLIRTGSVSAQKSVVVDRLGSVRVRKQGSTTERFEYYPYGEEKPTATAQDNEKFATYYRDAAGWDYADQRYYQSTWGRFSTVDPAKYRLNWYNYADNDPINKFDPEGLQTVYEWLQGGSTICEYDVLDGSRRIVDCYGSGAAFSGLDPIPGVAVWPPYVELQSLEHPPNWNLVGCETWECNHLQVSIPVAELDEMWVSGLVPVIIAAGPAVFGTLETALGSALVTGGIVSLAYDGYKALAKWKKSRDRRSAQLDPHDKRRRSRPVDAPPGTRPIDSLGLSKQRIHDIKESVGARPDDWVGVAPDGRIVTTDPQTGRSVTHGSL